MTNTSSNHKCKLNACTADRVNKPSPILQNTRQTRLSTAKANSAEEKQKVLRIQVLQRNFLELSTAMRPVAQELKGRVRHTQTKDFDGENLTPASRSSIDKLLQRDMELVQLHMHLEQSRTDKTLEKQSREPNMEPKQNCTTAEATRKRKTVSNEDLPMERSSKRIRSSADDMCARQLAPLAICKTTTDHTFSPIENDATHIQARPHRDPSNTHGLQPIGGQKDGLSRSTAVFGVENIHGAMEKIETGSSEQDSHGGCEGHHAVGAPKRVASAESAYVKGIQQTKWSKRGKGFVPNWQWECQVKAKRWAQIKSRAGKERVEKPKVERASLRRRARGKR